MPSNNPKTGSSKRKSNNSTNSSDISQQKSVSADVTEKALADSTTSIDGHPVHAPNKKWNVLCRYMHAENIYYEAKIMALKTKEGEMAYAVHYPGWSSRHDEVIPQSKALLRFKDYTQEDAEKAKDEIKKAQQTSNKKRKTMDKRTSGISTADESRSSTPGSGDLSVLIFSRLLKRSPFPILRKAFQELLKRSFAKRKTASSIRRPLPADVHERRKDMPQILLPDALRRILIDDENLINKSCFLPKLPARITAFDIVQKYRETVNPRGVSPREFYIENSDVSNALLNPTAENLEHSALGLLDYFEQAIGTILLYKFERPMFNDLYEKLNKEKAEEGENGGGGGEGNDDNNDKEEKQKKNETSLRVCFAKQFGLPHLLRMFVRFTDMLGYTDWSERSLEAIIRHAQDFVMFLNKNHQEFFNVDEDYVLASADYHKRVWGNNS
ncbi:MRG domain-containing protein [Meloidogyne graminicola]|uniref:MRG domain-containing protein n=1 Tax=Meloidogyne graminicola TaxID=189291 RepID=A0A8T0A1M0_9BILA|nr:MRG domain-containing protein [Meloidogyne graminicola]